MSSYQLSIPSSDTLTSADKRVPVHASFSHTEDILAVLWESGYVEIWDLHTRIELGRGKVMEPTLTWKGNIGRVPSSRQVAVTAGAIEGPLARITMLGSDHGGVDIVTVVELEKDSSVKIHEIKMLHRNGCLVASDETAVWQAPDGQIFEGEMLVDDSMKHESTYIIHSSRIPGQASFTRCLVPRVLLYLSVYCCAVSIWDRKFHTDYPLRGFVYLREVVPGE